MWTGQNRQFPAAETNEFYFVPSSVRRSACTFVRQLRGPHDDEEPHELVSITIAMLAAPAVKAAIIPAAAFVGGVLSDVVTSTVADGVKYLLSKFARRVASFSGQNGRAEAVPELRNPDSESR